MNRSCKPVWALPVEPNHAKIRGELERMTEHAAPESYPSISADSRRMVFWSDRSGNAEIWLKDLGDGRESRLTLDPAYETFPMISADGTKVAYQVVESEKRRSLYLLSVGPEGQPGAAKKVCEDSGNLSDLSPDGEKLIYYQDAAGGIILVEAGTGGKVQLLQKHRHYAADPRFSPDARWIAFHVLSSAVSRQIFIAPVRLDGGSAEAEWIPVTDGSAMDRLAAWSPDGSVLYFISERDGFRCIWARRLDPAKKPLGSILPVYHFHTARRAMSTLPNVNLARLSVARDKIVFSLLDRTGNIWMTKLGGQT
jgi:eukaryotic-like serine/threonine-protein kinase